MNSAHLIRARFAGNIFNGTGSNNLKLDDTVNPGTTPGTNTAVTTWQPTR